MAAGLSKHNPAHHCSLSGDVLAGCTGKMRTCRSSFQPSSFNLPHLLMLIMAAVATSAALPWTGVLMAALMACPLAAPVPGPFLLASGSCRCRPSSVHTYPCFSACFCCLPCQSFTCSSQYRSQNGIKCEPSPCCRAAALAALYQLRQLCSVVIWSLYLLGLSIPVSTRAFIREITIVCILTLHQTAAHQGKTAAATEHVC